MSSETGDTELERIRHQKYAKMLEEQEEQTRRKKKEENAAKGTLDDDTIFRQHLYDRGEEVVEAAFAQFPNETIQVEKALVQMIRSNKFTGMISGGELLFLLRSLGLDVKVDTHITIVEHGKAKSLQDKLKESLEP